MTAFRNEITYNQLSLFKQIVEAGNISKAAKRIGIRPASVSNALKTLEQQIGQPLFIRTTRAISPTEAGLQLYESTHRLMDEMTVAVDLICDMNEAPSGKLSINLASSIYHLFLKTVLIEFQKAYPLIELNITLSDTLDDRVKDHIDVGFRYGDRVDETLIARPIIPLQVASNKPIKAALFVSAEYAQKQGIPQSIAELSTHPQVKFRMPSSGNYAPLRLHSSCERDSEILNINTPTAVVVNDFDVLVDMVAAGFGMGMMMDNVLQKRFDSGELIPVLEQHWCDIPTVNMYYARESKQSLKVRCFVDYVLNRCSNN